MSNLLPVYLIVMNIYGFILMGVDKGKAIRGIRRIPESTLFLVAVLGGSAGVFMGMQSYRHKTRHVKFTVGIPLIFTAEAVLALVLAYWTR